MARLRKWPARRTGRTTSASGTAPASAGPLRVKWRTASTCGCGSRLQPARRRPSAESGRVNAGTLKLSLAVLIEGLAGRLLFRLFFAHKERTGVALKRTGEVLQGACGL